MAALPTDAPLPAPCSLPPPPTAAPSRPLLPPAAPGAGALVVNFDSEVLQLVREARYLARLGLPIPPTARGVLLQEEKFAAYFNALSAALRVCCCGGWVVGQ